MPRPASHRLVLLFALLALLQGCAHSPRVIPEDKMALIYSEMFLSDQWLRDHPDARRSADTTLFYDPIFRDNGVSFEDYDRSVHYYLEHPDDYNKILTRASEQLRYESQRLLTIVDAERARRAELDAFRRSYQRKDFSTDSLRWAGVEVLWPVREVPESQQDTLRSEAADSLRREEPTLPVIEEGSDTWEPVQPAGKEDRPVVRRTPLKEKKLQNENTK